MFFRVFLKRKCHKSISPILWTQDVNYMYMYVFVANYIHQIQHNMQLFIQLSHKSIGHIPLEIISLCFHSLICLNLKPDLSQIKTIKCRHINKLLLLIKGQNYSLLCVYTGCTFVYYIMWSKNMFVTNNLAFFLLVEMVWVLRLSRSKDCDDKLLHWALFDLWPWIPVSNLPTSCPGCHSNNRMKYC